jgi:DNA anti-recombination protein RmuC
MGKLPFLNIKIDAKESKVLYLQQMEEFREARASERHERELHVHIKEMHTHIRKTGLKEEDEL